jgi:hypothetical protein
MQVRSPFRGSLWSVIHRALARASGGSTLRSLEIRLRVTSPRRFTRWYGSTPRPAASCGPFTTRIVGLNEAESATLLAYLLSHINNPAVHCRTAGDPVGWRCGTTARPSIWMCPIVSSAGSCTAPWSPATGLRAPPGRADRWRAGANARSVRAGPEED